MLVQLGRGLHVARALPALLVVVLVVVPAAAAADALPGPLGGGSGARGAVASACLLAEGVVSKQNPAKLTAAGRLYLEFLVWGPGHDDVGELGPCLRRLLRGGWVTVGEGGRVEPTESARELLGAPPVRRLALVELPGEPGRVSLLVDGLRVQGPLWGLTPAERRELARVLLVGLDPES